MRPLIKIFSIQFWRDCYYNFRYKLFFLGIRPYRHRPQTNAILLDPTKNASATYCSWKGLLHVNFHNHTTLTYSLIGLDNIPRMRDCHSTFWGESHNLGKVPRLEYVWSTSHLVYYIVQPSITMFQIIETWLLTKTNGASLNVSFFICSLPRYFSQMLERAI